MVVREGPEPAQAGGHGERLPHSLAGGHRQGQPSGLAHMQCEVSLSERGDLLFSFADEKKNLIVKI